MHWILTIILNITLLTGNKITQQANMSVLVTDVQTGQVVDAYREQHVVPPASVMKLLTTGAALELLGPDFRFPTTLEYTGALEQGVVKGDLYVRGTCDPSLLRKDVQRWAQVLQKQGVRAIEGRVIADMTLLDGDAQNPNWLVEDIGNYYAPGIFGLNYMNNTMNIVLKSTNVGDVAEVVGTEPAVPNMRFINHVRCSDISYDGAFVNGMAYSQERYLTGSVPAGKGSFGVRGDLPNPGLLLAQHLTEALRAAGIQVAGDADYIADYAPLKVPRTELYVHQSAPLKDLIAETNIHSNNLYAESIFRYLGTIYSKPGTIHNATEVVRDFWRRRGVQVGNALIKDGCGLAPQDAVSAEMLVQLLLYMDKSANKDAWIASLPVSGKSGTLRSLLAGTELEGRVHAKSGTISGTKNFAGYIDMPGGKRYAFAVLINSAPGKARNIQPVIEKYLLDVYRNH